MQQTASKTHTGAESALETLNQIENGIEVALESHGNRARTRKPNRRHAGSRAFFSTGQAAQELGTSIPKVRALCETGMIEAEVTPGKQWRVPVAEVERLKRDGLPPIPRPIPEESADFDESDDHGHVVDHQQSSAVAAAAEEGRGPQAPCGGPCDSQARLRKNWTGFASGRGKNMASGMPGPKASATPSTRPNVSATVRNGLPIGSSGQ